MARHQVVLVCKPPELCHRPATGSRGNTGTETTVNHPFTQGAWVFRQDLTHRKGRQAALPVPVPRPSASSITVSSCSVSSTILPGLHLAWASAVHNWAPTHMPPLPFPYDGVPINAHLNLSKGWHRKAGHRMLKRQEDLSTKGDALAGCRGRVLDLWAPLGHHRPQVATDAQTTPVGSPPPGPDQAPGVSRFRVCLALLGQGGHAPGTQPRLLWNQGPLT